MWGYGLLTIQLKLPTSRAYAHNPHKWRDNKRFWGWILRIKRGT